MYLVKNIRFAIQIIQNHKIVNFKESAKDYNNLIHCESNTEIYNYIESIYNELKSLTDGILKKEILDKLNNERDF